MTKTPLPKIQLVREVGKEIPRLRITGRYRYPKILGKRFDLDVETSKSKTEQSHKDDCDINKIVKRYRQTGILGNPNNKTRQPMYGDFTNIEEYQTIQNRLIQATDEFALLNSDLRAKFGNNPANLVEYLSNPDNLDEARQLGILPTIQAESGLEATPSTSNEVLEGSTKPVETNKESNDS